MHPSLSLSAPRRLLLADDDVELRLGVAELIGGLSIEGAVVEILEADDVATALTLASEGKLHAALLDMYMPGGTGLELLSRLRELHAGLPCIVYSGRWSPDLENDVLRRGAQACLKKPVDPLQLRNAVLRALAHDARVN